MGRSKYFQSEPLFIVLERPLLEAQVGNNIKEKWFHRWEEPNAQVQSDDRILATGKANKDSVRHHRRSADGVVQRRRYQVLTPTPALGFPPPEIFPKQFLPRAGFDAC